MKLSKRLQNLISKFSSTREGVWGLGWQIANLIEKKLPIDLEKSPLNVYDDQVRQYFSSKENSAKTNLNPVDIYLSEKIEKFGQYEEYSIMVRFQLNDEEIISEEEIQKIIQGIIPLLTQHGLTYRQDIRPQWQSEYDFELYGYKWLPVGSMGLIGK